jgi:hypothetical protein
MTTARWTDDQGRSPKKPNPRSASRGTSAARTTSGASVPARSARASGSRRTWPASFRDLDPGLTPNSVRPAERWFTAIRPGMPSTHPVVALTLHWIDEWLAAPRRVGAK